jgi:hypothetical protein
MRPRSGSAACVRHSVRRLLSTEPCKEGIPVRGQYPFHVSPRFGLGSCTRGSLYGKLSRNNPTQQWGVCCWYWHSSCVDLRSVDSAAGFVGGVGRVVHIRCAASGARGRVAHWGVHRW